MTSNSSFTRNEMMNNWSFNIMRMSWKIADLFSDPSKVLDDFEIQAGWTVVDYGCGPGRYIERAAEQVGPAGKVYAVDIHDVAISCTRCLISKKTLQNVIPVQAHGYFAPIPENTADLIYVLDVFHMISQPTLFLHELHRLLKPEGKLILEDGHQKRRNTSMKVLESKRWRFEAETDKHLILKPKYKIFK